MKKNQTFLTIELKEVASKMIHSNMTHLDVEFGVEVLHNGFSDECFGTVLDLH
jgi:hypothetical protein